MATKFFPDTNGETTPAAPAATSTAPTPATREQKFVAADDIHIHDEGVRPEEGDRTEGGGRSYPSFDSFPDTFEAGEYEYVVSVNKVAKWPFGTVVSLRVEYGPDRGRQHGWEQSPPQKMSSEAGLATWRGKLFSAYAAGGWPRDPDPTTGWPGWKNQGGARIPPYYLAMVTEAADESHVPVLWQVHISVRTGYEKFASVMSVKQYLIDGRPVQAPMPYAVPSWLAAMHRWSGTREDITIKSGDNAGRVVDQVKLQYDQFRPGHCKMPSWKDLK